MIGATLDSNVYVRALHFRGQATLLLGYAKADIIRIDLSEPIIKETLGVLREKFAWDGYSLNDAREQLTKIGNVVTPTETLNVVPYDPPDNRIFECAAAAKSEYIVSEDKDLLRLGVSAMCES